MFLIIDANKFTKDMIPLENVICTSLNRLIDISLLIKNSSFYLLDNDGKVDFDQHKSQ